MQADKIRVAIGMPRPSDWVSFGAARGYFWPVEDSNSCALNYINAGPCTLLNTSFNRLWAAALDARDKDGITHFAMIHNDVCPEDTWLLELIDELTSRDADIVSAIVPIKDDRGLTSTAVIYGDIWTRRRLTMTEVMALPETFGSEDVGGKLLLNTGLWVCDLRKPWCDQVNFESLERITIIDGDRVAEAVSEDWLFSYRLHEMLGGAALYATRKVKLYHDGGARSYVNHRAWGNQKIDEAYFKSAGVEPFPLGREAVTA